MPKIPVYNCIQYVYSLCAQAVETCGRLYTGIVQLPGTTHQLVGKPHSYTHFSRSFTPYLYTAYFRHINLLYTDLYPVSTAPTITKTKEK